MFGIRFTPLRKKTKRKSKSDKRKDVLEPFLGHYLLGFTVTYGVELGWEGLTNIIIILEIDLLRKYSFAGMLHAGQDLG